MCAWIIPPVEGLLETSVVPEIYSDGETAVEIFEDNVRFYLTARQMVFGTNGVQHVVVGKIIKPLFILPQAMVGIAKAMNSRVAPGIMPGPRGPRLVS